MRSYPFGKPIIELLVPGAICTPHAPKQYVSILFPVQDFEKIIAHYSTDISITNQELCVQHLRCAHHPRRAVEKELSNDF